MSKEDKRNERVYGHGGVVFVGVTALGVGLGLMYGDVAAWTVLGFGAGLVCMGIVAVIMDRR